MSWRLADLFPPGSNFRVVMEESWRCERPENKGPEARRFNELIPCQGFKAGPEQEGAFIGLYSDSPTITLHLITPRVKNVKAIWEKIKDKPGCQAEFLDGEATLLFPADLLPLVAEMAGARKRRTLSAEQKEAMRLGRERAGLIRDEKGQWVHLQAQKTPPPEAFLPGEG